MNKGKMEKALRVERINDPALLDHAFKIREEVFIIEQNVAREEEYDQFEDKSRHFLVWDEKYPCGTARWRSTGEGLKLERFAVLKPYRGRGVGALLVQAALDDIGKLPEHNSKKIYLNAQVPAVPFYEKFAFRPEGDRFMECDIEHQKMGKY